MSKKLSTYLDFELKTSKEEVLDEFGISKKKARKITAVPFIVCPLCGFSRKYRRTGKYAMVMSKKLTPQQRKRWEKKFEAGELSKTRAQIYNPDRKDRFDIVDTDKAPFLSIRMPSGRGKGISEVAIIKLTDVARLPESDKKVLMPLIYQIRSKCKEIIEKTDFMFERFVFRGDEH